MLSTSYLERSHSGLVRTLGKRVVLNGARGFESPLLLKFVRKGLISLQSSFIVV